MPEGAVYVGRPTKWGNPYRPGDYADRGVCLAAYSDHVRSEVAAGRLDLEELRGKDLACWCGLGTPCHADVLLRLVAEVKP